MRYTESDLFDFMKTSDSGKKVEITTEDDKKFIGSCWAYSATQCREEYGVDEPCLEVGPGLIISASEIKKIDIID